MIFLIWQYGLLLVVAFALGIGVGWLAWGRMAEYLKHSTDVETTKFQTRLADLGNEVKVRSAEAARLHAELSRLAGDDAALRAELGALRAELAERQGERGVFTAGPGQPLPELAAPERSDVREVGPAAGLV